MRFALSIFVCLFLNIGFSQDYYTVSIQQFDEASGLLGRRAYSFCEDRDGFIWLGYKNGLQRFDGTDFKTWPSADYPQLSFITSLHVDQAGWIWMWNHEQREFHFMNPSTEEIKSEEERFGDDFPDFQGDFKTLWFPSNKFETDERGKIYFLCPSPKRLITFDTLNGFISIPLDKKLQLNHLHLLHVTSKGDIWTVGGEHTEILYHLNPKGDLIDSFTFPEYNNLHLKNSDDKRLFLAAQREDQSVQSLFFELESEKLVLSTFSTESYMYRLGDQYWLYENHQWEIYDLKMDHLHTISRSGYKKSLVQDISGVHFDRNGRIWITSIWGLSRIIIKENPFKQYLYQDPSQVPVYNNAIRGIHVNADSVYAVLESHGIVAFSKKEPNNWSFIDGQIMSGFYYGGMALQGLQDRIIAGLGGKIIEDVQKGTAYDMLDISDYTREIGYVELGFCVVWSAYENNDGTWLGTAKGLWLKDDQGEYSWYEIGDHEVNNNCIYQIIPANDDEFWLCTDQGLFLFDHKQRKISRTLNSSQSGADYLPATTIHHLHIDQNNIFWLATKSGLVRWDPKTSKNLVFTTKNGLSSNEIYAIYPDEYGNLWLSSANGIMQINLHSQFVSTYLEKDGITHNEFNRISSFQDIDGTIYFGGLNGITAFHPKNFLRTEYFDYEIQITNYELYKGSAGKVVNQTQKLKKSKTINFEPGDRYFKIHFAIPILDDYRGHLYAWRINSIDENWTYQKENVLQLTELPYGEHLLEIKGQTGNGKWTRPLQIELIVSKPFYLTSWFIILCTLLLIGSIILFFVVRIKSHKKRQITLQEEIERATEQILSDKKLIEEQALELKKLDSIKSRFFANVTHELRTPISLISAPIQSVMKSENLTEKDLSLLFTAKKNTANLLKLVNSLLDLSKLESGKMTLNEKSTSLYEFSSILVANFESVAQKSGIHLQFEYHASRDLKIKLDAEKLETILNNLVSNAIKFTAQKEKVVVTIEERGANLQFQVKDTGRGIHEADLPHIFERYFQSKQANTPAEGGTGIGLALSQELTKVIGGHLSVESELGKGTTFQLTIPRKEVLGMADTSPVSREEETVAVVKKNPTLKSNQRIIVVEDNHDLREYLVSLLDEFYIVSSASNGKRALELLDTEEMPDLILSDIMMPEMDGYQLLSHIKSSQEFERIPVVMLTAKADTEDKLKALRIGVDDYILKPFEEEELKVRIENLLKHSDLRKRTGKIRPKGFD